MPRSTEYVPTFCIYCQREYVTHERLVRHIARMHPGTYAYEVYVKERG